MCEIACPKCGTTEDAGPGSGALTLDDIGLYRCEGCAARFVFGREVPRVVVEPCRGPRGYLWARVRIFDPATGLETCVLEVDPMYADALADNLRAMTRLGRNPRQRAV